MVVPAAPEFSTTLSHIHMDQDSSQTVQKAVETVAFKVTLQINSQISSKNIGTRLDIAPSD